MRYVRRLILLNVIFFLIITFKTKAQYDDYEYNDEDEDIVNTKNFIIEIHAGYNLATGDIGNIYSGGLGLGATIEYRVTKDLSLHLTGNYINLNAAEQLIGGAELKIVDFPVRVGGKYWYFTRNMNYYFGAELGWHFYDFIDKRIENYQVVDYSKKYSNFGLAPLVGATFNISDNFFLNFNANYTIIFGTVKSISYLGLNAGVGLNF